MEMTTMKYLSVDADAKTIKGKKKGYITGILFLAPHTLSGYNLCPEASEGCSKACLYTAGRGRMLMVQRARIRKTIEFMENRPEFLNGLRDDIKKLCLKANRKGMLPAVRLNGTSDFPWEKTGIIDEFPEVQFYDYTKILKRAYKAGQKGPFKDRRWPKNYHLTFSRSETNMIECWSAISAGCNVSFVFKTVPSKWTWGSRTAWDHIPIKYDVVNGDEHDLRFLDPTPCIVGLKAKGEALEDTSGFVI